MFLYMNRTANVTLKRELNELLGKFYPQVDLCVIFTNNKISTFFQFKDRIPLELLSNVVYKYTCPHCSEAYVGETSRHLKTRIAEHKGISPRTGLRLANPKSNIFGHFEDTGHFIKKEHFTILATKPNSALKVIESIFIHQLNPSLNGAQYSTPIVEIPAFSSSASASSSTPEGFVFNFD